MKQDSLSTSDQPTAACVQGVSRFSPLTEQQRIAIHQSYWKRSHRRTKRMVLSLLELGASSLEELVEGLPGKAPRAICSALDALMIDGQIERTETGLYRLTAEQDSAACVYGVGDAL